MGIAPRIESRSAQSYLGKRVVIALSELADAVPALIAEVTAWVQRQGGSPAGRPFVRYHVVHMPDRLDIEAGLPVAGTLVPGDGIAGGTLPSGRYAVAEFTGVANGIAANQALLEWIRQRHEQVASHPSATGDAFVSRYETTLTDPQAQPDQSAWRTEIAIQLRD